MRTRCGDCESSRRGWKTALCLSLVLVSAVWQKPALALTAGNSVYQVHVQDTQMMGVGLYTITTGSAHPAGQGLNVLFGNGTPGTSFNTIRSYASSSDYVQRPTSNAILLDSFGNVTPIGTTGARTTYVLPGPPTTPDALTIVSDVNVRGTTVADSTVEVTTSVTNNGANSVAIGVRYLWDVQIGSDDGPTFQQISPNGAALVTEAEFTSPAFVSFRIQDNDTNPTPPTFFVFGTVTGPGTLFPIPTTPDLLQVVCWELAQLTAFGYTIDPSLDIADNFSACSTGSGGDSAVLYFFGHDAASALQLDPGATVGVSASLFLTQSTVECGDNAVNQPSEQCDGTDDASCPGQCLPDCTCQRSTATATATATETAIATPTATGSAPSTPTVTVSATVSATATAPEPGPATVTATATHTATRLPSSTPTRTPTPLRPPPAIPVVSSPLSAAGVLMIAGLAIGMARKLARRRYQR